MQCSYYYFFNLKIQVERYLDCYLSTQLKKNKCNEIIYYLAHCLSSEVPALGFVSV